MIIKSTYYSNWADIFGYPIAYFLMKIIKKFDFITPNIVTLFSFSLFTFGSVSLFLNYPYHLIVAAICIFMGYIGDDIDGQLARAKNLSSPIGDYLDKVLDVLKIFIINSSLAFAAYLQSGNILHVFLGFIACFFFMFRYYIKLETMFSIINADSSYLSKSAAVRKEKEVEIEKKAKSSLVQSLWIRNRIFFWVDEAEFAVLVSLGALFNKLDLILWTLAVSQLLISSWRFYERITQIKSNSKKLLEPLRK